MDLRNNFFQGDSGRLLDRMSEIGYKVDVVLTSPPYNNSKSIKAEKSRNNLAGNKYDVYTDSKSNKDYISWLTGYFNKFDKVLNENGVCLLNISYGSDHTNLKEDVKPNEVMWLLISSIITNTEFTVADCIIWKKSNALPNNTSSNKLTRIIEFVFVIVRKSEIKTFNSNKKVKSESRFGQKYYESIYNFIEAPNNDGRTPLNQATFSSELCEKLLNIYAKDESVVLDPFMGTGSTAIGCLKSGRGISYIGFELSKAQVEYSKARVNEWLEKVEI